MKSQVPSSAADHPLEPTLPTIPNIYRSLPWHPLSLWQETNRRNAISAMEETPQEQLWDGCHCDSVDDRRGFGVGVEDGWGCHGLTLPGCCSACGEGWAWISAKTEGKDARQVPVCLREECQRVVCYRVCALSPVECARSNNLNVIRW